MARDHGHPDAKYFQKNHYTYNKIAANVKSRYVHFLPLNQKFLVNEDQQRIYFHVIAGGCELRVEMFLWKASASNLSRRKVVLPFFNANPDMNIRHNINFC